MRLKLLAARLDVFDLSVGRIMPNGERRNFLLEVKMPGRENDLKPSQVRLLETWKGQYDIVSSVEQALAVVGIAAAKSAWQGK
jgi:hypothetical protein